MFGRKFVMTKEENLFFAKRNLVDYIWKSANLEGIGVTYPDTQAIFHNMSVSGYTIDQINAVNDLKHAWSLLLETIDEPLDLSYIQKIHRELGRFTVINSGSLRLDPSGVGGTAWVPEIPDRQKISEGIARINANEDPLDKALHMFAYLCKTQAFYDGNKRIATLISNKIMIENGLGIISVPQSQISVFYQELIKYYEEDDLQRFQEFLYDNCLDGMNFTKGA